MTSFVPLKNVSYVARGELQVSVSVCIPSAWLLANKPGESACEWVDVRDCIKSDLNGKVGYELATNKGWTRIVPEFAYVEVRDETLKAPPPGRAKAKTFKGVSID